jgi:hypothetical protein
MDPSRFRVAKRISIAAGAIATVYAPAESGDVLNLRQLTVSTDTAAEVVVFFGDAIGERLDDSKAIRGLWLAANGGASPDLGCLGAWSPKAGLPVKVYCSATAILWVAAEGVVEG